MSSEKLTAILGEFERVDELSDVQFCLSVAAKLLLTSKQPDPEHILAHYVETILRLRPGLYSRTVCDATDTVVLVTIISCDKDTMFY